MSVSRRDKAHGGSTKQKKVDPMTTRIFALGVVTIAILMALYLALTASSVKLSVRLWSMHNEMADIQRENSRLETEIARNSSIPVLQERSVRMGYGAAESIEYLIVGGP
jgi:cell division protein FtsL